MNAFLPTCVALTSVASLAAQTTVTFTNGVPGSTAITTTAPNSPVTLLLASGATTQTAAISGSGGVIKTGAGALTIAGSNTYTGATSVNVGTLVLQSTSASPSFAIASGAALELDVASGTRNNAASTTFTGTGNLVKTGAGTLRWDNSVATFALGAGSMIDVRAGNFVGGSFGNDVWTDNLSNLNVEAGALFTGSQANVRVAALTGAGLIRSGYNGAGYSAFTFGLDNASGVFSGELADYLYPEGPGAGNFVKVGSGTQVLTGVNSYTGTTTIIGGTLQLGDGGSAGSLASTSIVNNASLVFNRSDAFSYTGNISGSGSVSKQGSGTLTLSGVNSHTGGTTVFSGTLVFTRPASLRDAAFGEWNTSHLTVESGATAAFRIGGSGQSFLESDIYTLASLGTATAGFKSGSSLGIDTTDAPGGAATYSYPIFNPNGGANILGFEKLGSGTLTLAGANSYTGLTRVTQGTLVINGGFAFPHGRDILISPAGTLYLQSDITPGVLTLRGGTIGTNGNGRLHTTDASVYESGLLDVVLIGAAGLNKTSAGTLTLTRANTFTGATTIHGGTVRISTGGTLAGPIVVNSGGALSFGRGDAFGNHTATPSRPLTVQAGGLVTNEGYSVFNTLGPLTLNGGELRAAGGFSATWTAYQLKGTVTVGGSSASSITTTGAANSEIQIGNNTAGGATTFAVADATGNSAADLTVSAVLQNGRNATGVAVASGLMKTGAGTLALASDNTFTGATTVSAGALRLGNGGSAGSVSGPIINDAVLAVDRSDSFTLASSVSGAGLLVQAGSGTLILTGANDYSGGTLISGGTLQVGNGATSGGLGSGTVENNSRLVFDRVDEIAVFNTLVGAGSLTQSGSGLLALGGDNAYTGGTTFAAGTVRLDSSGALGATGGLTFTGGTLQFTAANHADYSSRISSATGQSFRFDTNDQSVTFAGSLAGSGNTLFKTGGGALTFTGSSTYTGATSVNAGTLVLQGTTASPSFDIESGAALELDVASGTRNNAASTTFTGTGNLVKTGAGTLRWDNSVATFALGAGSMIDVRAGNFVGGSFGNDVWTDNLSNLNVEAGALFTGSQANVRVAALTGAGLIRSGYNGAGYTAFTFGLSNASGVFSGELADYVYPEGHTGAGNFVKVGSGTQVLAGANSYTGTTTISGGTLQIGGGGSTGSLVSASIVNNASLAFSRSDAFSYSGNISGFGSVSKQGAGTLTLSGANSHTGGTTVSSGTLVFTRPAALRDATLGAWNSSHLTVESGATAAFRVGGAGEFTTADLQTLSSLGTATAGFKNGSFLGIDTAGAGGGVLTYSGNIANPNGGANSLGLVKSGSGTLALSGVNTYTGPTRVSGGTLSFASRTAFHNGDTARWTAPNLIVGSGASAVFKVGGAGEFTASDLNTLKSLGTATGGFLGGSTLGLDTSNAGGGVFAYAGSIANPNGGTNALALTKLGAGVLTLTGGQDYTGPTTIDAGTLRIGAGGSLYFGGAYAGSVVINSGATLEFARGDTFGVHMGSPNLAITVNAGGLLTHSGSTFNTLGSLALNGGELRTAAGSNPTWTAFQLKGPVAVGGSSASAITTTGAANSQIQIGNNTDGGATTFAVADVTGDSAADLTISAVLQNGRDAATQAVASGLMKTGAGTLALTAANTFTGTTTLSAGTLVLGVSDAIAGSTLHIADSAFLKFGSFSTATFGGLSGSGDLALVNGSSGALSLTLGGNNASTTYSGKLSGAGSLNKVGTGALVLSGANTHSGGTIVAGGVVEFSSLAQFGSGSITLNGGGLRWAAGTSADVFSRLAALGAGGGVFDTNANNLTLDQALAGSGGFTKTGGGVLTVNAVQAYSGVTRIRGGELRLAVPGALGGSVVDLSSGGALTFASSLTSVDLAGITGAGGLALANVGGSALTLNVGAGNLSSTTTAVLSGPGSLVKVGSGTFTLNGDNTYAGETIVREGTLVLGGAAYSLGATAGRVVVEDGGTLSLRRTDIFGNHTFTSNVTVAVEEGGLLTNRASFNTLNNLTLAGGELRADGGVSSTWTAFQLKGLVTVRGDFASAITTTGAANSEIQLGSNIPDGFTTFAVADATGDSAADLTVSAVLQNGRNGSAAAVRSGLLKTGAGTLVLDAANTFSGTTTVSGGRLVLGVADALAYSTLNTSGAGAVSIGSHLAVTLGGISGAGDFALVNGLSALALTVGGNNASTTYSGVFSGSGSLRKVGTGVLTLSGVNGYSGGTTIAGGLVEFSSLAQFGSGPITLDAGGLRWAAGTSTDVSSRLAALGAGGGTFDTNGGNLTLGYALSGAGGFTKSGAGTLTVVTPQAYAGPTRVSGGELRLAVADAFGGSFFDNSGAGSLTFASPLTSYGLAGLTGGGGGILALVNTDNTPLTLSVGAGGLSSTSGGVLAGAGSLVKTGAGMLTLTGNNSYTGPTIIDAGTLRIGSGGSLYSGGAYAGSVVINDGATLDLARSDTFGNRLSQPNLSITINAGGRLTHAGLTSNTLRNLTLNGGELRAGAGFNSFQPAFQLKGTVTAGGSFPSVITTTGAANSEIQLGNNTAGGFTTFAVADATGDSAADLIVSAVLQNGRNSSSSSVASGLVKTGAGTLTLAAANTFTGATTVSAGTLFITGSLANTAVAVNSGATLGGSGGFGGLATIRSGAILAPGNSPGTITFTNGLALNSGAILDFEFGETCDLIRVSGGAFSSDGAITVNLSDSGGFAARTYTLIDATGATLSSIGATSFELGSAIAGYNYTFRREGSLFLLDAVAVPEPATFAALAGLLGLGFAATRRRRRAA